MPKQESEAFHLQVRRLEKRLMAAYRIESDGWAGEVEVVSIKIKLAPDEMSDTMVVVTGVDGAGTPVVAFHSGIGLLETFAGALSRVASGQIKWRIDEYKTQNR